MQNIYWFHRSVVHARPCPSCRVGVEGPSLALCQVPCPLPSLVLALLCWYNLIKLDHHAYLLEGFIWFTWVSNKSSRKENAVPIVLMASWVVTVSNTLHFCQKEKRKAASLSEELYNPIQHHLWYNKHQLMQFRTNMDATFKCGGWSLCSIYQILSTKFKALCKNSTCTFCMLQHHPRAQVL